MTPIVHLSRKDVTRAQKQTRAFPLSESDMPFSDGTPESVHKIIEYLNVPKSPRYQPDKLTYCNIYAYDFAYLMNAYVPRVYWSREAIRTKNFIAKYGSTVFEMNANALYDWFPTDGVQFGWEQCKDMTEAQKFANDGKCVIMVAANKNRSRSGHIVAVVPETNEIKSIGARGVIIYPVQSQAGVVNRKYQNSCWWKTHQPVKCFVFNPEK